ncbi:helix-turn-helix domain-containing protein [Paenibacillus hunanensis]|nr:helix-turn-helix domain-containing protein [Paenibacillus hunanensis]WPP43651.1 helix-turn-helix domain-containing protein [Paenibacillus hunanensis]
MAFVCCRTNKRAQSEPIAHIAYKLGFEYPANFSKFFKARTGLSPNQFRK